MTPNTPVTAPKVLVIIVTWNKKFYVLQLLESLVKINYPTDALDIVVVDNASNDDTVPAIQQQYPQVRLIQNSENIGGTGGFNTGMQWAFEQPEGQYDYLWLLDNDVMVHCNALNELINILTQHTDIAVAGSTMMQLDYPWRINEMGCFFDFNTGNLVLNRHHEELSVLRSRNPESLAADTELQLSRLLSHCQPFMDVDYVAAASLLIRAPVARQIGLWKDFFIHFDDVEWCLRIGKAGYRIVVAANSLIWHLSAAAKVPTWVLYYDNRNLLVTLASHGASNAAVNQAIQKSLKRCVYYALLGKADLGRLCKTAVDDFLANRLGKKAIQLETRYQSNSNIKNVLLDKNICKVLVGNINLQATNIQAALVQVQLQRPELELVFLTLPSGEKLVQLPRGHFKYLPKQRFMRWWFYWRWYNHYDVIMQSDYVPYPLLSLLSPTIIFVNDDGFAVCSRTKWRDLLSAFGDWLKAKLGGAYRYTGKP